MAAEYAAISDAVLLTTSVPQNYFSCSSSEPRKSLGNLIVESFPAADPIVVGV